MKTLSIILDWENSEPLGKLLVVVIIAVAVFLILRQVMLWYWKVNDGMKELKKVNSNLEILITTMGGKLPEADSEQPKEKPWWKDKDAD